MATVDKLGGNWVIVRGDRVNEPDEISDLVRMISIVDTFSALIDARSYKEPRSREQAFQLMLGLERTIMSRE